MTDREKKIKQLIEVCMNPDGTMKSCGREACKTLLAELNDSAYGNSSTGALDVTAVYELYQRISSTRLKSATL